MEWIHVTKNRAVLKIVMRNTKKWLDFFFSRINRFIFVIMWIITENKMQHLFLFHDIIPYRWVDFFFLFCVGKLGKRVLHYHRLQKYVMHVYSHRFNLTLEHNILVADDSFYLKCAKHLNPKTQFNTQSTSPPRLQMTCC